MKWDNLILLPLAGFISWPLATLIPASIFAFLFYLRRIPFVAVTAVLWGLYGIYEYMMKLRILCSGECNIRVDLLVIIPALYVMAIVAVVKFLRKKPDGAA